MTSNITRALCEASICHFSTYKKSPFFPLTNKRAIQLFNFGRGIFKARFKRRILHAESNSRIIYMQNATFKSIKFGRFVLNASSVEYSTDPVEYATEVRQLI